MDAGAWTSPADQKTWCLRMARDLWQFDQQACSSPQVLYLEKSSEQSADQFLANLKTAFENENRAHPRQAIASSLSSTISKARASWLLNDPSHRAFSPSGLTGQFSSAPARSSPSRPRQNPLRSQGRQLEGRNRKVGRKCSNAGLGLRGSGKENEIASIAGQRGIDRVVKLGRMHTFVPPWDGVDLIRPMVRMVRHVSSAE